MDLGTVPVQDGAGDKRKAADGVVPDVSPHPSAKDIKEELFPKVSRNNAQVLVSSLKCPASFSSDVKG